MEKSRMPGLTVLLITTAGFVITVAGMKAAASLIVPFLLAVFIAIICMPAVGWLKKHRVPNVLAILIVLLSILILGSLLITLMGTSLANFSDNLPTYQARLTEKSGALFAWLNEHHITISNDLITKHLNPNAVMNLAATTLSELSSVLTNAFMIFVIVIFMLFELTEIPAKVAAAVRNPEKRMAEFEKISSSVNRYMAIKTLFCLGTGIGVGIWLWILDVDYALLWGILAFLLNYVPSIGSIIAAVPAILLAIIQFGLGHALLVALGYVGINALFGTILEPRFMGKGLGLSTLVVFLSLIFWGWILGPVGMLLSVPLTMILKIIMEQNEETRSFSILIGGMPPTPKHSNQ
jgi:AI-2 transport protein TqsA